MTTQADAQNEKRKAAAKAETGDRGAPTAGAGVAAASVLSVWGQMLRTNEELMRFGLKRAGRYQQFFKDARACASPADAVRLYSEVTQQCVADYVEQTQRLARHQAPISPFTGFFPTTKD